MSDQFDVGPYTGEDEPLGHFDTNEEWHECPRNETCEFCGGQSEDSELALKPPQ